MHVLRNDEFLNLVEHALSFYEKVGNNAGYVATALQHCAGGFAHKTNVSTAIHQANIGFGQRLAKNACSTSVNRVYAGARTAINTNILHIAHEIDEPFF